MDETIKILEQTTPLTDLDDIRVAINALSDFDHVQRNKDFPERDYDSMRKYRDSVNARIPGFTLFYSDNEQCYVLC